jgi:two-component system response regulator RegA
MSDERPSLLLVEDDERFAETLASEFRERGYDVVRVESVAELCSISIADVDYAVVDLRLRQDSGLDAVAAIVERAEGARVVVLTGYGSIATAVQATKLGAANYLTKPVDIDDLERAFRGDDGDEPVAIPEEFQSLARHEREYIEYVLEQSGGNISRAARRLGLHRQSLQRKLRKYTPQ